MYGKLIDAVVVSTLAWTLVRCGLLCSTYAVDATNSVNLLEWMLCEDEQDCDSTAICAATC